jgi:hypothetical protein
MSRIGYILSHPVEASRTFWRAFTGTESLSDRIEDEQARLKALRMAIALYDTRFGRLRETLQDLCHNNHNDSEWTDPFIRSRGEDTFHATFGFPYRYGVADGRFEVVSPGLETATRS